ncbi:hypothetical protein [Pseudobacillus wudalianchiensis]|uniref:Uncharacterized protein n=1 Tax=Pseudobacillus wudalianchiensis TaxID=1743143 RepID=A0A1B9ADT9_9BACI|nr:hypothetical protein [Bacillus wudalianchiensis]OCA82000.1 hypothetical protein A8F95_14935 [Bacillus wudalianchiensis]
MNQDQDMWQDQSARQDEHIEQEYNMWQDPYAVPDMRDCMPHCNEPMPMPMTMPMMYPEYTQMMPMGGMESYPHHHHHHHHHYHHYMEYPHVTQQQAVLITQPPMMPYPMHHKPHHHKKHHKKHHKN